MLKYIDGISETTTDGYICLVVRLYGNAWRSWSFGVFLCMYNLALFLFFFWKEFHMYPPHICLQETFYYFILALAKERNKQQ